MTPTTGEHWVLVVNGELPTQPTNDLAALLRDADCLVAVDGGLRHCADLGVWPTILLGDLDSAANDLVAQAQEHGVDVHAFPADKDATDLELGLSLALDSGAVSVTVVAGFGGRLDHELATVSLLASDRWQALQVRATDGVRHVWVVHERASLDFAAGTTVSLIPWHGQAVGVTTRGLQWPLHDAVLSPGTTWGVSNVAVQDTQEVAVTAGVLVVVVG